MPTGYTADVADGKVTDLRTFALLCARAFGAAVMQRDDPMHEPPKPREVSDYAINYVAERERVLAALNAMTPEEAEAAAGRAYQAAVREQRESAERETAIRNRYNAMLAEVMAWEPPTVEHVGLKDFMVQQLTSGRDFDTGFTATAPVRLSGAVWLANEKALAAKYLSYAQESLAKEVAAVEGANRWIEKLYAALPAPVAP